MSCETPYFSGLGNCQKLLSRVVGIGVSLKGTTFTDATFISLANWKTIIATSTPANRNTIVLPLRVYENTSDDVAIETSNLGMKEITSENPPSMVARLLAGPMDYQAMHLLAGTKYEITLFLADGTQVGCRTATGAIKGFRAVLGTKKGLPLADGLQNSYPLYVFFQNVKEFENQVFVSPDYSLGDVTDLVPVGLTLVAGALSSSTGVATITVYKRGTTQPHLGLVVADVTVLESTGQAPVGSTTLVEVGQGVYTLTINEDVGGSASALDAGEWAKIQVNQIAATYITYASQPLKITAV